MTLLLTTLSSSAKSIRVSLFVVSSLKLSALFCFHFSGLHSCRAIAYSKAHATAVSSLFQPISEDFGFGNAVKQISLRELVNQIDCCRQPRLGRRKKFLENAAYSVFRELSRKTDRIGAAAAAGKSPTQPFLFWRNCAAKAPAVFFESHTQKIKLKLLVVDPGVILFLSSPTCIQYLHLGRCARSIG